MYAASFRWLESFFWFFQKEPMVKFRFSSIRYKSTGNPTYFYPFLYSFRLFTSPFVSVPGHANKGKSAEITLIKQTEVVQLFT